MNRNRYQQVRSTSQPKSLHEMVAEFDPETSKPCEHSPTGCYACTNPPAAVGDSAEFLERLRGGKS